MSEGKQYRALADAIVAATDAAGIGLVITRMSGPEPVNVYVSDAAARILRRTKRELLGPAFAFTPPEELPRMRELGDLARRREPVPLQFETEVEAPLGVRVPIEVSISHVASRDELTAVTFIIDITERRQAEQALLRSEASFRQLVETAPLPVWIADRQGLAYANAAAGALFGFDDVHELLGVDPRRFVHAEDLPVLERRARAMLRRRERLPPYEYRAQRRDAAWMIVEVSSIAVEYHDRPAILSFGRDVTERRQLEAQMLQADRLAALGALAGGMAHAINNPLTYVLLNLDHVAKLLPALQAGSPGVDELLARLDEAHQGAERVAEVVKQMRAFSRADEHARGPVDVRRVLDGVVGMLGNEMRHRGELVVSYSEVPHVTANPARLEQAFLSLLLHAAQALPGDGDGEVRITVKADGSERVIVEVLHTSRGRAPDASAEQAPPELGIGICRNIISALGGSVHSVALDGGGTLFRVSLPASGSAMAPARSPAPSESSIPPPARTLRARVLVVDDDPGVGRALRLMLEEEHEVTSVTSGREALRMLLKEQYDVVFCDVMMPELTGMDLYQALRLNRPGDEQRLVFMTGGVFTPNAERFLAQVKNPRIEKPFDMKSLRRLVERAVRLAHG